jgi:isopentenyldiphosphate isomerase
MLIQHRQPWKTGWPNMWDLSVGGSSVAGEDSIQAAERETREELGYEIDLSEERPFFTINFKHGFDDFYIVEQELELSELHLQQEEVQAVKWASKDEIKKMVREGIFIDYYFLDVMFEMRKQRGAIREK